MSIIKNSVFFAMGFLSAPLLYNILLDKKYSNITEPKERLGYEWRYGRISYTVQGEGKPIVLLHGLYPGSSLVDLDEQVERYAKTGKVYAFDFLGYGYSDKPKFEYSSYLFALLLNDFVREISGAAEVVTNEHTGDIAILASQLQPGLITGIIVSEEKDLTNRRFPSRNRMNIQKVLSLPIFGRFIYNIIISEVLKNCLSPKNSNGIYDKVNEQSKAANYKSSGAEFAMSAFFSGILGADLKAGLERKQQ